MTTGAGTYVIDYRDVTGIGSFVVDANGNGTVSGTLNYNASWIQFDSYPFHNGYDGGPLQISARVSF